MSCPTVSLAGLGLDDTEQEEGKRSSLVSAAAQPDRVGQRTKSPSSSLWTNLTTCGFAYINCKERPSVVEDVFSTLRELPRVFQRLSQMPPCHYHSRRQGDYPAGYRPRKSLQDTTSKFTVSESMVSDPDSDGWTGISAMDQQSFRNCFFQLRALSTRAVTQLFETSSPSPLSVKLPTLVHVMRCIQYAPKNQLDPCVSFRFPPHTDSGAVTLLALDGEPGLEVYVPLQQSVREEDRREGTPTTQPGFESEPGWVPVVAPESHIVVNVGDLMHTWTGGALPSSVHRVQWPRAHCGVEAKEGEGSLERYTIAFFTAIPMDAEVTPSMLGKESRHEHETPAGKREQAESDVLTYRDVIRLKMSNPDNFIPRERKGELCGAAASHSCDWK